MDPITLLESLEYISNETEPSLGLNIDDVLLCLIYQLYQKDSVPLELLNIIERCTEVLRRPEMAPGTIIITVERFDHYYLTIQDWCIGHCDIYDCPGDHLISETWSPFNRIWVYNFLQECICCGIRISDGHQRFGTSFKSTFDTLDVEMNCLSLRFNEIDDDWIFLEPNITD